MSPEDSHRFALRRAGCLVRVHLAVGEQHRLAFEREGEAPPSPVPLLGLIDTGADVVAVRPGTFANLGVVPTRPLIVQSATADRREWPAYTGRLAFAEAVIIPCTVVEALERSIQGIDCLIGRDILAFGEFVYEGSLGRCRLTLNDRAIRLEDPLDPGARSP